MTHTATVTVLNPRRSAGELICTKCGAGAKASCDCGAEYVPAGKLAAQAVAANPAKSDRAIAAELGVNNATVSRARQKSGVAFATPDTRTGRDGKSYPATRKSSAESEPTAIEQFNWTKRKIQNLTTDSRTALTAWLKTKPKIDAARLDTLADILRTIAEEYESMAAEVQAYRKRRHGQ